VTPCNVKVSKTYNIGVTVLEKNDVNILSNMFFNNLQNFIVTICKFSTCYEIILWLFKQYIWTSSLLKQWEKNDVEAYFYWVLYHKKFQNLNINKSYFCILDGIRRNFNCIMKYLHLAPLFLSHKMSSHHS
jgi:hypothetical protein